MVDKKTSVLLIGILAFSLLYSVMLPNGVATTGQISFNIDKNKYVGYDHFDIKEYQANLNPFLKTKGPKNLIFNSGAKANSFSSYTVKSTMSNMGNYCEDIARGLGYIEDFYWPTFRPLWDSDNYHTSPPINGFEMWQSINGGTFYIIDDGLSVVIADGLGDLKNKYKEILPGIKNGYMYCVQTS